MSYVIAAPEYLAAAATDLSNIGSALSDANSAALGPVSSVLPAGADEVSASIAALFGAHAQAYEAISAAAQAFHAQFVQLMSGGAEQYVLAEAANATPLQTLGSGLLTESTAPAQAFTAAQPVAGTAASTAGSAPLATAGLSGWFGTGHSPGAADDLGCTGVGSAVGARSGRHGGGGASRAEWVVGLDTGRHGPSGGAGGIGSSFGIGGAGVGDHIGSGSGGRSAGIFSPHGDAARATERHLGGGGADGGTSGGGRALGQQQRTPGDDARVGGIGGVTDFSQQTPPRGARA